MKTRACDLDSRDRFWMSHKGSPFPTVAEAIQEELEQYRSSEEEVKRLKASMVCIFFLSYRYLQVIYIGCSKNKVNIYFSQKIFTYSSISILYPLRYNTLVPVLFFNPQSTSDKHFLV